MFLIIISGRQIIIIISGAGWEVGIIHVVEPLITLFFIHELAIILSTANSANKPIVLEDN